MAKGKSDHCGAKSEDNKILKVTADFDALIMSRPESQYLPHVPPGGRCVEDIARMTNCNKTTACKRMRTLVAEGKAQMVIVKRPGIRGRLNYIIPV